MISGIFIEGLIYGIMVLGVFGTFRVLNFCDMTVDGSFPMGACILAACLAKGLPVYTGMILAFTGGLAAGLVTGLIYSKLHIPDLLAGILTMTMLYSINIRIMHNSSIYSYLGTRTLYDSILEKTKAIFPSLVNTDWGFVAFLVIFVLVLKSAIDLFYHTDMGLTMGALGSNPQLIISQGVNPDLLRIIGICFGNGMAALAGALFSMYAGSADVSIGTGTIVSGLASLMLGEFVIRSNKIELQTFRVLLGSCIYRALIILARRYGRFIGLTANDLKLITGILIILCLIFSKLKIYKKRTGGAKND